ncbi:MAG: sulfatase [Verrucomicrobiota bacterium]
MSKLLSLFSALCLSLIVSANGAITHPNIVLIIADDMAWNDSTPYGHPTINTPNIQKLADGGMRFDNAFLTISSCSPSRASIITGRYPHQTDAEELHWPLPAEQITFVEKLRAAGYWAGAAGKWHLGDAMRDRFDDIREVDTSGFQLPTGEAAKAGKFKETLQGEAQSGCADWIPLMRARDKNKPFFLWLAALDPHRPYHENIITNGAQAEDVRIAPYHADTPETRKDYTVYYDEITRLDKYVGRVMAELEKQGVAENTLVLFFSDNGRPFPRDKTTVYDSGIKTPWIVHWPAKVKAGSSTTQLVSSVDIARTAMDAAGVSDIGHTFEGHSFLPLLTKPNDPTRDYIYAEKNWHDYEDHVRAVRNRRYKYIRNYYNDLPQTPSADSARSPTFQAILTLEKEGKLTPQQRTCLIAPRPKEELYDTQADPHELNNLITSPEHQTILKTLQTQLKNWEKRTKDYAPTLRTADEFDRITGVPTKARVRPRLSKKEMVAKGLVAP